MRIILSILIIVFCFYSVSTIAQCDFQEDYSFNTGWTQVGVNVEIANGKLNYLNGAADGTIQRRVHAPLGTILDSDECWIAELEFTPQSVGVKNGQPYTGHVILALTAGTQEAYKDCPDLPCTGLPNGTQDGVIVTYTAYNPPNGDLFFKINARENGVEYRTTASIVTPYLDTTYYVRFYRNSPTLIGLEVYWDVNRARPLTNSPISLAIPAGVTGLTTVQHGNAIRGEQRRQLTGTLDNLCINWSNLFLPVSINLPKDTALCKGDILQLDIGVGKDYSYAWNTGSTDSVFTISEPGTYIATVKKACAISTDTIVVSELTPPVISLPKDTVLCEGDSLKINIGIGGNFRYSWNTGSVDSLITISSAGTYIAYVTDVCTGSDTLVVTGVSPPKTQLRDTVVCDNQPFLLSIKAANATFLWSNGDTTSSISTTSSGLYSVEVQNVCGTLKDQAYVEFVDCKCKLALPNIFTPNNDGENDHFEAVEISTGCIVNLSVFNRWGRMVFETKDIDFQWDGGNVADGVYFWIIDYTDITGEYYSEKGTVTIMR